MRFKGSTKRQRLKALTLTAALFATGVQYGYAQEGSRPVIELSDLHRVSTLSTDNRNPAVAFDKKGERLFVIWDGLVDSKRRILLRERVAGNWLPPVIVDKNPAGQNNKPSLEVDASGNPHATWITTNGAGQRAPAYARRLAREQNSWYQQIIPFPAELATISNSDVVKLQLDDSDRPWIVWQHGFGNTYNIATSRFTESGEIVTDDLTPGSTTHNLFPELFFDPEPVVYWYMWDTDQFYLITSRFDLETKEWKLTPPENLELLPAGNLPDLFNTDKRQLAAIWYDRYRNEANGTESDRIFIGLQDPETKGRGEVIGSDDDSSNDSVTAIGADDLLITAWVSETFEAGAQIVLAAGNSPEAMETVNLSEGEQHKTNPRVSAEAGEAAVVWEQETLGGADAAIMLRSVQLD